jgi:hypothetical protein
MFIKSLEEQNFIRNTVSVQTTNDLPWDTLNKIDCAKKRCENLPCNTQPHKIETTYTSKDIVTYDGTEGVLCQGCWTLDANNKHIPCGSSTSSPPSPAASDTDDSNFVLIYIVIILWIIVMCAFFCTNVRIRFTF